MTLYAILSDIHANFQALEAVVEDARRVARREKAGKVHFVCLGDVVDYGPQPNECVAWVQENAELVVQGNHEQAVVSPYLWDIYRIKLDYRPITLWTWRELKDDRRQAIGDWESKYTMPPVLADFTLFHGSLAWGVDGYIKDVNAAEKNLSKLDTNYGLFGHTHLQGYFVEKFGRAVMVPACSETLLDQMDRWQPVGVGKWEDLPEHGQRALFNPGSVGQPRHYNDLRDYRAAYMLLKLNGSERQFQFRRVAYNVEETVRRLREVRWSEDDTAEMERWLCESHRLERGNEAKGSSIYKDERDAKREDNDPLDGLLQETLEQMPERLRALVEGTLIPTLIGTNGYSC